MSSFTPTLRLHDRYVLRARIGLGGMSEVWRADDEVLHRSVAIKALAGQLATDPELRATIQREARAAARLTHPHVTQVYDYGEAALPGGAVVPYLVMELVEGHSLADRLTVGPLPWPEAVRTAGQIAAALAAAHRIGVVHRDIKPGNVMLTETGAKVLDFGIAALAGPRAAGTAEPLMGTPAYFAPERMTPGPPHPASDVYALGALLYRALTGRAPLPVQTWEDALEVHARRTPVPPLRITGLPADVADLTMACLATDPDRRPTAAQLADRFGAGRPAEPPTSLLPTVSAPAHPPTLIDRAPATARAAVGVAGPGHPPIDRTPAPARPGRPEPRRALGVLVAAGLALLAGLVGVLVLDDDPDRRTPAAPVTAAPPQDEPVATEPTPAAEPTTAAPPSRDDRPQPRTARELAAEFAAVLDRAEASGDADPETVEELRKKLAELAEAKPKDRGKRLRDLAGKIQEAVERDRISDETVIELGRLLATWPRQRGGGGDDDD
ncbi:protein kinase domain-containing protein [Micromonospora psammae]|uniref:protein kinase domain-containing protein n=1 Tax=Micromonospora sp. CPCC 205556 TaxID=3122398 RepID=UPI002FF2C384